MSNSLALKIGFIFAVISSLPSCNLNPGAKQDTLIRFAFEAIKRNDWNAYSKLTLNLAEVMLAEQKISRFEAKLSYTGQVLAPENTSKLRTQFGAAVQGGDGLIDFKKEKFKAIKLIASEPLELLTGSSIPVEHFSVITDQTAGTAEPRFPVFVLSKWKGEFRIVDLMFPPDEEAEEEEYIEE